MNPKYKDFNPRVFPRIKPIGLANALRGRPQMDRGFEALLRVLLRFEPATRMSPILALCLEYFEQLRNQKDLGQEIEAAGGLPKELFKFTSEELLEVGDSRRLAPRRVESPQIVAGPDNTTHTTPSSSSFKSDTFQPLSNSATITTNSS